MPMLESLPQLFARLAATPHAVVAYRGDQAYTAAEFAQRIGGWAQAFARIPGPSVALYLDDSIEFAAALFGGWHAGKTLWLPADMLPATVARLAHRVHGFAGDLPATDELALLRVSDVADADCKQTLPPLNPHRCQLTLYTSGSSGEPVAVAKALRQLDNEVRSLQQQFGDRVGKSRVEGTVSHQHIYGLLFRVLWPLASGRAFAARRLEYPEQIAALRGAITLVASPAHLKRLPETLDWQRLAESLRVCFSSGGPLPVEAAQAVLRLWRQAPIEVYGSTETGGIGWRQYGPGCAAWQPLPSVQWQAERGLLQVRSTHLHDEHWYQTEDRAVASPDGGFELLGRADRIYKLEERRISLTAIEQRLLDAEWLTEAKVLVLPGARALIAAVGVLSDAGEAVLENQGKRALVLALRQWLEGQIDPIALPRRWRFAAALPADAQGKCTQAALAALFRPQRPQPRWLQRDAETALLTLQVDPELAHFDGHFPGSPVLPGVAMLDWALHYAAQAFAIDTGCQQMEVLKFQHIVRPGAELELELRWQDERRLLSFSFRCGELRHASGRFRLGSNGDQP